MSPPEELGEGVFAVVVNWNGGEQNHACLRSLQACGLSEQRIVFVDNGSRDGSLEAVRSAYPELIFLENGANLGFGEGANGGARIALERGASAVWFVNSTLR